MAARGTAGVACIIASALGFGAMAILARIAYASGVDIPTLLALRFAIAAIIIVAMARASGATFPRGANLVGLVLLGAIGYAGQAFTFFAALGHAPAGIVALLLYTHPALVALLSAWLLHEALTPRKIAALAIALAGTFLTVLPSLLSGDGSSATQPAGVALGLSAAVIYACYIVGGARITKEVPVLAMSAVVVSSAAVVFVLVTAVRGAHWPATAIGWWAVIGIALVCTVAAITLYFAGLARVGPTRAATLSTVEPVFTVLLAAVVLGERAAGLQLVGGALILFAVVLLARAPQDANGTARGSP